MPTLKDVCVHVTDGDGEVLPEWGLHKLKHRNVMTCYIQSETNLAFGISIKPTNLYSPHFEPSTIIGEWDWYAYVVIEGHPDHIRDHLIESEDCRQIIGLATDTDIYLRTAKTDRSLPKELKKQYLLINGNTKEAVEKATDRVIEILEGDEDSRCPVEYIPAAVAAKDGNGIKSLDENDCVITLQTTPELRWHLNALLRLDGRKGDESIAMIYLDREELASNSDGEIKVLNRTVRAPNGKLRKCGWIFKDIGIESLDFHSLNISEMAEHVTTEEHNLVAALNELGNNAFEDAGEQSKFGQIEIILQRVTVLEPISQSGFEPDMVESEEDTEMVLGSSEKISHRAANDSGRPCANGPHEVTYYYPVEEDELPFAVFKFYYRSEDVLRRFNFEGFAAKRKSSASDAHQSSRQGALGRAAQNPLGIMHQELGQRPVESGRAFTSYEARSGHGTHRTDPSPKPSDPSRADHKTAMAQSSTSSGAKRAASGELNGSSPQKRSQRQDKSHAERPPDFQNSHDTQVNDADDEASATESSDADNSNLSDIEGDDLRPGNDDVSMRERFDNIKLGKRSGESLDEDAKNPTPAKKAKAKDMQ